VASSHVAVAPVEIRLGEFFPLPTLSWDPATAVLNRQSGLFEMRVDLANPYPRAIKGFGIQVTGLPDGVTLRGTLPDGSLLYPGEIPAGGTAVMLLEFYAPGRRLVGFVPRISAQRAGAEPSQPLAGGLKVTRVERVGDAVLIEFNSVPGQRYQVDYSGDSVHWKASSIIIEATSNRVQWLDRGPPFTDSPPGDATSRFYRFSELGR
jgi:hypothetical protein